MQNIDALLKVILYKTILLFFTKEEVFISHIKNIQTIKNVKTVFY